MFNVLFNLTLVHQEFNCVYLKQIVIYHANKTYDKGSKLHTVNSVMF